MPPPIYYIPLWKTLAVTLPMSIVNRIPTELISKYPEIHAAERLHSEKARREGEI
jgi:hypothetical protein